MARLNLRPRSPSGDSLFRGRTPTSPNGASDKENQALSASTAKQSNTMESSSNPPRRFGLQNIDNRDSKRRRVTREGSTDTAGGRVNELLSTYGGRQTQDAGARRYYNPKQNEDTRRQLRLALRKNIRELHDRRDEFINDEEDKLISNLKYQNALMSEVRQTSDAVLDSRYLLDMTELTSKRLATEALGSGSRGVDVDEFISRCVLFMKNGGPAAADGTLPPPTQRRRRNQTQADDSDNEDITEGDHLDWESFGEKAAFPNNLRPSVPSLLLGPLSVEKKVRNTQRTARQRRDPVSALKRPEELGAEDLEASEGSNLTKLCESIRERLEEVITEGAAGMDAEGPEDLEDLSEADMSNLFKKFHLSTNYEVSLFEFAINPHSFGQSVENLFYVSFLVKDGFVCLSEDEEGLPTIRTNEPKKVGDQHEEGAARHQAIFSLDHDSWRKLVTAFDIQEPLIAHRVEETSTQVNARGWYG